MRPQRLGADELTSGLLRIPSWSRSGDVISRAIAYPSFLAAIEAVNRIATVAEEADHHPDIDIRWRTVHLSLTTHDVGGLTELDLDLAGQIDAITDELGGSPTSEA
jgi:4a-hydroxytetrahydrobiopterin dehydratase